MRGLDEVNGLSPDEKEILRSNGIHAANQLVSIPDHKIVEMTGLHIAIVQDMIKKAQRVVRKQGIVRSGLEMEELEKSTPKIKTGLPAVDEHMNGGISHGSIIEVYGPQWGCKTLLCIQIGVMNQEMGDVLWYDADGTFREETVREIAFRMKLDPEAVLKKFHVVRPRQGMSIDDLSNNFWKELSLRNVYLIVIDSLTKTLLRGSPQMNKLLQILQRIQSNTETTILFTSRASVFVSGTLGQDRESRSYQAGGLIATFRILVEPIDEHKRRLVLKNAVAFSNCDWSLSLGYGGLYQDQRIMKSQERRVKRYLKRLNN